MSFLALMNILLFLLPVEEGNGFSQYSKDLPLKLGTPERSFTFSRNWDFSVLNQVSLNSSGFHDHEYEPSQKPQVLFVGDSYFEGYMVPLDDLVSSRLSTVYSPENYSIRNLGLSGAGLATHLAVVKEMLAHHDVAQVFILINGDDFDESSDVVLNKFHFLKSTSNLKSIKPRFKQEEGSRFKQIPFLRYIYSNLKLWPKAALSKLRNQEIRNSSYYKLLSSTQLSQGIDDTNNDALEASYFLSELASATGRLEKSNVVLIHSGEIKDRFYKTPYSLAPVISKMIAQAKTMGFSTINLDQEFRKDWAKRHVPHNFTRDRHWNSAGHRVLADTISREFNPNNNEKY